MDDVIGVVDKIKYRSEETDYTVCSIKIEKKELVLVGNLPYVSIGEEIHAFGDYVTHPEFGEQFRVSTFTKKLPSEISGILKYLSSGAIKGIGVATAARMVDIFGETIFDIIENSPEQLARIKGINQEKALNISKVFKEQYGIRELLVFFGRFSVSSSSAMKVWKRFGPLSISIIKANPYTLAEESVGISFNQCDLIAEMQGLDKEDELRVSAAIKYILRHNFFANGHTYLPKDKLITATSDYLIIPRDGVMKALEEMIVSNVLVQKNIKNRDSIFLLKFYQTEQYIAKELVRKTAKNERFELLDNLIDKLEANYNIKYDKYQREAISFAVNNMVMVLTGGPGTGKTTTLKALIRIFKEMGLKVILTAPTGRAVKRMEDICGESAKTLHRLLETEYNDDETSKFFKNEENKIEGDIIIVDEVSMVDVNLLEGLLRALDIGTRLVLVGDADQLPSVGAGNVLRDIIKSEKIPSIKLTHIFRQASKSLIVTNSHKIINGEYPTLNIRDNDFFFIPKNNAENVVQTVGDLVKRRLPTTYGFDPLNDIQVITPSKMSTSGTKSLNAVLREILNPADTAKKEKQIGSVLFRTGDKIMQTKNNYNIMYTKDNGEEGTGVFNGDIGIISEISNINEKVYIKYDDKRAAYEFSDLIELDHAYAITVHKSQGSEFEAVVMPVFGGSSKLFYRNLLYTAVTRAKKMVILVGDEEKIYKMVDNNTTSGRYTALCELIKNE